MKLAMIQAWELGLLRTPINFYENPLRCIGFWVIFAASGKLQLWLNQKYKGKPVRLIPAALSFIGMAAAEIACQTVTVLSTETLLVIYCAFFTVLLGAAALTLYRILYHKIS